MVHLLTCLFAKRILYSKKKICIRYRLIYFPRVGNCHEQSGNELHTDKTWYMVSFHCFIWEYIYAIWYQRKPSPSSLFSWTAFTLSTPFCLNFSCCMKNLLRNYVDYRIWNVVHTENVEIISLYLCSLFLLHILSVTSMLLCCFLITGQAIFSSHGTQGQPLWW